MQHKEFQLKKQFLNLLAEALKVSKKNSTMKNVLDDFILLNFLLCVETLSKNPIFGYEILKTPKVGLHLLEKLSVIEISYLLEASKIYYQIIQESEPLEDFTGYSANNLTLSTLSEVFKEKGRPGLLNLKVVKKDIDNNMILLSGVQIMSNIIYHRIYIDSLSLYIEEDLFFQIQRKERSLMNVFLDLNILK